MAKPNYFRDVANRPWQGGVVIAIVAWVALQYVLPSIAVRSGSVIGTGLAPVLQAAAPIIGGLTLLAAAASWWRTRHRRQLLDSRSDLASIQELSWERFEHLTGEVFRRRGYAVKENMIAGADRGIDLVLTRGEETVLVQCKRQRKPVSVAVVRELLGTVVAEGASRGVLVAAGRITEPTRAFAIQNDIELIDGVKLERLVHPLGRRGTAPKPFRRESGLPLPLVESVERRVATAESDTPSCPTCQSPMKVRTRKKDPGSGQEFLGCSRYPKCRGTRSIDEQNC